MTSIISGPTRSTFRAVAVSGVLAVVFAVLLTGCGEPPAADRSVTETAPTPSPIPADHRIVVLGDSIAAGLGLAEEDAFPAVVERNLRAAGRSVEVVNAGVSGDTSAGGLSRTDWILRQAPDVVVVELGANDALRGQPLDGTEANLREIVRLSRAAGARVVLLGMDVPTSYGSEYAGGFTELYRRIADDTGVELVAGFIREVALDPELMQPDGLHPNAAGQRRLAERLAPLLEAVLDELDTDPSDDPADPR